MKKSGFEQFGRSGHLEKFLKFFRDAGPESNEIPEEAVRLFMISLPVGSSEQEFARKRARMALEFFKTIAPRGE